MFLPGNSYPMTMPGNSIFRSLGCQSNLQQITHRKASSAPKLPRISIGLLSLVRCNWIDPVQEVRLFGVRQIFGLIWASQVLRIPICSLYLVEYNWGDRVQEARLWRLLRPRQIFAPRPNTFDNLDKYILQFGQISFALWTNTFYNFDKCIW